MLKTKENPEEYTSTSKYGQEQLKKMKVTDHLALLSKEGRQKTRKQDLNLTGQFSNVFNVIKRVICFISNEIYIFPC